ncbi:MAG: zinc ribbon domain-containing protein [Eubacteriales bacterium]|nr:zinc ribbon domain-containing protein [Eubacteriales bacterium]
MAFCSNCGSEIYAGNKFCSKCGVSVSGSPVPQTSGLSQQEKNALGMRLSELANNVDSLQGIMGQIEKVKAQFQIPEPRKPRTATRWWAMKGFVFGGIGAFVAAFYILLFLLSLRSEYDDMGTLIGGIVVIALICGVGITLIVIGVKTSESRMNRYNTNSINKYNAEVQRRNGIIQNLNNQYSELEKAKSDTVSRIYDCMDNGSPIIIPENYFYSEAIRFFADRIMTGRANSLSEAMDAYDAYIHRMKLEQAANEAAEYQRQSANNLAAIQREQSAMRRQGAVNTALHVANTIRHW